MIHDIVFALWFLLPAAAANVTPIFSAAMPYVNRWRTPLDGGRKYRGKELLGAHKTWRGLLSGILIAAITFWLQQIAVAHSGWGQYAAGGIDYASLPTLLLGPLFGLGALGGDALESFFKRQRGVRSGGAWVPFDQLDYILGGLLVSLPFVTLTAERYLWIIALWFGIHLLASYTGWLLGLKDEPI